MSRRPAEPELPPGARESLERILELLASERASVSSVREPAEAWRVHVEDSLTGLEVPELREAHLVADVGAGAGFPGLVLAKALPATRIDLVESVGRKCEFIRRAAEAGDAPNARVLCERAEILASAEGREAYDVVTARAVGRLSTLAELASPLLRSGGVLVAWKGRRDSEEDAEAERASADLAMAPEAVLAVGSRAGSRHRHLHVFRKTGPTPRGLPRKAGMAKKRPAGAA